MSDNLSSMGKEFGKRLRDLRNISNISQGKLGEICNVSRYAISAWELDKQEPDIETIIKLAEFFDVTTDELLGKSLI